MADKYTPIGGLGLGFQFVGPSATPIRFGTPPQRVSRARSAPSLDIEDREVEGLEGQREDLYGRRVSAYMQLVSEQRELSNKILEGTATASDATRYQNAVSAYNVNDRIARLDESTAKANVEQYEKDKEFLSKGDRLNQFHRRDGKRVHQVIRPDGTRDLWTIDQVENYKKSKDRSGEEFDIRVSPAMTQLDYLDYQNKYLGRDQRGRLAVYETPETYETGSFNEALQRYHDNLGSDETITGLGGKMLNLEGYKAYLRSTSSTKSNVSNIRHVVQNYKDLLSKDPGALDEAKDMFQRSRDRGYARNAEGMSELEDSLVDTSLSQSQKDEALFDLWLFDTVKKDLGVALEEEDSYSEQLKTLTTGVTSTIKEDQAPGYVDMLLFGDKNIYTSKQTTFDWIGDQYLRLKDIPNAELEGEVIEGKYDAVVLKNALATFNTQLEINKSQGDPTAEANASLIAHSQAVEEEMARSGLKKGTDAYDARKRDVESEYGDLFGLHGAGFGSMSEGAVYMEEGALGDAQYKKVVKDGGVYDFVPATREEYNQYISSVDKTQYSDYFTTKERTTTKASTAPFNDTLKEEYDMDYTGTKIDSFDEVRYLGGAKIDANAFNSEKPPLLYEINEWVQLENPDTGELTTYAVATFVVHEDDLGNIKGVKSPEKVGDNPELYSLDSEDGERYATDTGTMKMWSDHADVDKLEILKTKTNEDHADELNSDANAWIWADYRLVKVMVNFDEQLAALSTTRRGNTKFQAAKMSNRGSTGIKNVEMNQ